MKITLVRPTIPTRWLIMPPLGLMYISAVAKKSGHEVAIHDAWLKNESPVLSSAEVLCLHGDSDIVGIQMFGDTVEWTRKFISNLRKIYNGKIIIGGPYPSVVPNQAVEETGADLSVVGEFDNNIDNALYQIMHTSEQVTTMSTTDINNTPIPDWDIAPPSDYWDSLYSVSQPVKGKRIAVIQRTRGCPSMCTFCSASSVMGKKVRFRDDDNVLEEIKYLRDKWDINEIWFGDDNFIVNYDKGITLFEKLIPLKLHIRLPLGIRVENIDVPMVRTMKAAGVYFTGIGIESGNMRVIKRIKKNIQPAKMNYAINILNKYNITTIGFFIFGLPTETRVEMDDTIKFAMSTKLNHAQIGTFLAYPGAEDCNEKSLLSQEELIKIQRNATLRFYLRPRILWGLLKHAKLSQLKAFWNHYWIRKWMGRM